MKMNKIIIWIDDIRDPKNYIKFGSNEQYDIIWCKSYNEFVVALNDINEPYDDLGYISPYKLSRDSGKYSLGLLRPSIRIKIRDSISKFFKEYSDEN